MKLQSKIIISETTEKPDPHATETTPHVTTETSSGTTKQSQLRLSDRHPHHEVHDTLKRLLPETPRAGLETHMAIALYYL